MKKQSGFTLIELLLVLAIIGIISAIAIPALLGQRARARDRSCTTNATGLCSDIVSAYDKGSEAGCPVATQANIWDILTLAGGVAPLPGPLSSHLTQDRNPWAGTGGAPALAFNQAIVPLATADEAGARGVGSAVGNLGQVWGSYLPADAATGAAGAAASSVWVQSQFNDGAGAAQNIFVKIAAVE